MEFCENNYFALSQTLAQTSSFLALFSSSTPGSQVAHPLYQKEQIVSLFSVLEHKSALFGPKCDFSAPRVKPFINIRFWEVFWGTKTGKVHFSHRKCGIPPQNRISTKKAVWGTKSLFSRKGGKLPKVLHFYALKRCSKYAILLFLGPLGQKALAIGEIHQIW